MIARFRNPSLSIGISIVVAIVLAAIAGPMFFRVDPLAIDLANTLAAPSRAHPFGCDALGRDVLARVLWGARLSLSISTIVVAASMLVGSASVAAPRSMPYSGNHWICSPSASRLT